MNILTEVEKQEIEKEAREYGLHGIAGAHSTHLNQRIQSFKDGATAMAEKKNTEIENLVDETHELGERAVDAEEQLKEVKAQLKSTQEELSRLKEVVQLVQEFTEAQELGSGDASSFQDRFKQLLTLLEGEKK